MFAAKLREYGRDGDDVRARGARDRETGVVMPECSSLVILVKQEAGSL